MERVFPMEATPVREDSAPADAPKRFKLSFSSEQPVERGGFFSESWSIRSEPWMARIPR